MLFIKIPLIFFQIFKRFFKSIINLKVTETETSLYNNFFFYIIKMRLLKEHEQTTKYKYITQSVVVLLISPIYTIKYFLHVRETRCGQGFPSSVVEHVRLKSIFSNTMAITINII